MSIAIKVTFDSNTWRMVASPDNFPKNPIIQDYILIREAISSGKIDPFISETVFTLEAIKNKDRKQFFKDYKAAFNTDITEGSNGYIKMTFTIGPNENAHPGNNEFLKEHFADAVGLGFNIIHLPRLAGITNKDIKSYLYKMNDEILGNYLKKVFEVGRRITELEAGDYEIRQISAKYSPQEGFSGIDAAPDNEDGNIAKAIAEWADGDSIASHIAIEGDYFCTNDNAKKAGSKSVLSIPNIEILTTEYNLRVISPTDLANLLKEN